MKKENIEFFVGRMAKEGFKVKRFAHTPVSASYVGFELFKGNTYIADIVIDDDIKDEIADYYFGKFIMACKTIAIYKGCARKDKNDDTI